MVDKSIEELKQERENSLCRWKFFTSMIDSLLDQTLKYYFNPVGPRKRKVDRNPELFRDDIITEFNDTISALFRIFYQQISIFGEYWKDIPNISEVLVKPTEVTGGGEDPNYLGDLVLFNYKIQVYDDDPGQQVYGKLTLEDGSVEEIGNGSYNTCIDGILFGVENYIIDDLQKRFIKFLNTKDETSQVSSKKED